MSDTPRWRRYMRFWGPDPLRDVDDELAFHLDSKRDELRAAGVPPDRIDAELRRVFGDRARVEAELKKIGAQRRARARRAGVLDALRVDVRHAWRSFRRRPAVPLVVVVTLALCIGAGTAVFSLFDAVVLNPLPVARPAELVVVHEGNGLGFSFPMSQRIRERSTTASGIAGFTTMSVGVRAGDQAEQLTAAFVTGEYFGVLGLRPQVGRLLVPADEGAVGAAPYVVLSDALWQRRFGADPSIVGRTIAVNEQPLTVVGVAPQRFRGMSLASPVDVWIPVTTVQTVARSGLFAQPRVLSTWYYNILEHVARVPAEVPIERVMAELSVLHEAARLDFSDGRDDEPVALSAVPVNEAAATRSRADLLRFMWLLVGVVVVALAVACVNVANLMLMRATERHHELSIRAAIGASGARVARQLLIESGVLALLAAAGGIVVAMACTRLVSVFSLPGGIPLAEMPLALDGRMLAFTTGVAALCAILFGVAPARLGVNATIMESMRAAGDASQRRWRGGAPLVGAQVALCVVLLVAGSLFVRSLLQALAVDPGFRTNGVATLSIGLRQHGYSEEQASVLIRQLHDDAAGRAGVDRFAAATGVPIDSDPFRLPIRPTDRQDHSRSPDLPIVQVSPGYFEMMQLRLLRGRDIDWSDREGTTRVAVVTQNAADRLWPGADPIGKQFVTLVGDPFSVVGVIEDAHLTSLTEREPHVFVALAQTRFGSIDGLQLVGAGTDAGAVLEILRAMVQTADPRLPTFREATIEQQVEAVLMPQRFGSVLLGAFAFLALLISAVGIYAVAAYDVARRHRELGIRAALGAQSRQLVHAVIAPAALAICGGIVAGLAIGAVATQGLRGLLFGITPYEPLSYFLATALLGIVAVIASWLPARRAGRIDPLIVMRS